MTAFVFTPEPYAFLPVAGNRLTFPVRRIFCVAQNYASHAAEMGVKAATPADMPSFFMKPADSIAHDADAIPYPPMTRDLHHEIELVAAIGRGGANIARETALEHVFGYTVGLDLTRRDLQQAAKAAGKPWDMGKGFDHATPCGTIVQAFGDRLPAGRIQLSVNGDIRQDGVLSDMIWPVDALISILSRHISLKPGDILMTGTPSGVGAVLPGDKIDAHIEHVGDLSITIK
jgi:fumarylpyruvate hydrolase